LPTRRVDDATSDAAGLSADGCATQENRSEGSNDTADYCHLSVLQCWDLNGAVVQY
jgi:hypothetical protein